MYKLIIFDLDGTILNTLEDLADSTNYALVMNGFSKRTIEEVRTFVGNGIGKLIERAVPAGTDAEVVNKVLADFTEYYGKHCADKTRPYDGILELINILRERGYQTAVVSNKADFAVQELCEQYFPGLFDFVVGALLWENGKGFAENLHRIVCWKFLKSCMWKRKMRCILGIQKWMYRRLKMQGFVRFQWSGDFGPVMYYFHVERSIL